MKLKEAREHVDTFTGRASELTRQLAFAGIAVVWVFKNDKPPGMIPDAFALPLLLLVLTLAFDFLHYLVAGIEWTLFTRKQEDKHGGTDEDSEIDDAPSWLNLPHAIFYYLKLLTVVASYVLLTVALSARL